MTAPVVGKWYYVTWVDAVGNVSGNPDAATACVRQFAGRFVRSIRTKRGNASIASYVFASGVDEGNQTEVGYTVVPVSIVTSYEPLTCFKTHLTEQEMTHGK